MSYAAEWKKKKKKTKKRGKIEILKRRLACEKKNILAKRRDEATELER